MIQTIRDAEEPVILVDCGGFYPLKYPVTLRGVIVETTLTAMNIMDYTAVNIGTGELSLGPRFFSEKAENHPVPFVTSNITFKGSAAPPADKYILTKAGNLTVAILGVVPTEVQDKYPALHSSALIDIVPPGDALAAILPDIRKQADIVILLSHLGNMETRRLLVKFPDIDLAVYGGSAQNMADESSCGTPSNPKRASGENEITIVSVEAAPKSPVLNVSGLGTHLGYAHFAVGKDGKVELTEKKNIYLTESMAKDERIKNITGDDMKKMVSEYQKRQFDKKQRTIERLHKMTPMEYVEEVLEEQKEKGDNR